VNTGRTAAIAVTAGLLGSCCIAPTASAEERYVRDWQVERPLISGVIKGLTLGAYPPAAFGLGSVAASPYDPYGMSAAVHGEVRRLGSPQHHVGVALGAGWWMFVLAGVIHRRLLTLRLRRLECVDAN
jgi:hypothetical protein